MDESETIPKPETKTERRFMAMHGSRQWRALARKAWVRLEITATFPGRPTENGAVFREDAAGNSKRIVRSHKCAAPAHRLARGDTVILHGLCPSLAAIPSRFRNSYTK